MAESRSEERVLREALYSLVSLAKSEQILVDDQLIEMSVPHRRLPAPAQLQMQ